MTDLIRAAWERALGRRRIDEVTECWEYLGNRSGGYGTIHAGRSIRVHRLAAHLHLGLDLNSELCVLHKCDNPPCFNPDHLFLGTRRDNNIDRDIKGRTVFTPRATLCRHGHDVSTPESRYGDGRCRECHKAWTRRNRAETRGDALQLPPAERTHCPSGHPYDDENTRWRNGGRHRVCRACISAQGARRRQRKRQEAGR